MSSVASAGDPQHRKVLDRSLRIGTATWSDAMDELGLSGVVSGLVHRSGEGRCAGFAMTVRGEVGELGTYQLAEFGQDRMVASAGPTQVLVVDLGGVEVSGMGGIVALSAKRKGIEGAIINGACRDIDDIRHGGLWVASRHVTPRSGKRRVKLGHFGEPVTFGGVTIHTGDLIVGDATGVIAIPRDRIESVLSIAERISGSDSRLEKAVESGRSLTDAAKG